MTTPANARGQHSPLPETPMALKSPRWSVDSRMISLQVLFPRLRGAFVSSPEQSAYIYALVSFLVSRGWFAGTLLGSTALRAARVRVTKSSMVSAFGGRRLCVARYIKKRMFYAEL
ncbi:hypothetical protein BDZ89DRAFT_1058315 [Hymenopellis radicata]|nr:hypothetical protein BDZ89DRAFT_1058315 [Hymenopellis radicata]